MIIHYNKYLSLAETKRRQIEARPWLIIRGQRVSLLRNKTEKLTSAFSGYDRIAVPTKTKSSVL